MTTLYYITVLIDTVLMIKMFTGSHIRSCKSYCKFTHTLNNWNYDWREEKHIIIEQYVQKES